MREIEPGDDRAPMTTEPSGRDKSVSGWRFRLAIAQHHRAVYRLCYGYLRDGHEAEDVTQEAFLKYWQRGSEVQGVKAWLLTVARNACLDRLRTAHRWVDVEPAQLEFETDGRDPEWQANRDESAGRLQALVDRLPEPQRSLVLLFDVEGLTGAECAEVLGLSINQVKVYLHRATWRVVVTDLDKQWAETQVEAFVDGSLSPESAQRVQAAMLGNPGLRRQVERAREVQRGLRSLRKVPVPAGLAFRLLSIPGAERAPRPMLQLPAAALAAVGAIAIGLGSYSIVERHQAEVQTREMAVRDFQLAMVYLQKSTALANSEMTEAVGLGVRSAVTTSRDALQEAQSGIREGGSNNVD
ncbi:MAG: sigma-70 family RNA polymerase sigma factor [Gammaproteobacteria bacterium]